MTVSTLRALVVIGLLTAAGAGIWYAFGPTEDASSKSPLARPVVTPDPPPPDPRLTFDTPFRNVRPQVKYLGDAACVDCHAEITHAYHQHPMGRSAAVMATAPPIEDFRPAANNPVTTQGFTLEARRDGDVVRHIMTALADPSLPPYITTADIAIGSGARGRSYLSLEENGAVWQSPLSWFSHESKWDASPGFTLPESTRRPIVPECLFCHVDRVEPVPYSLNRFQQPLLLGQAHVGCERCHGPGELHVAERTAGIIPDGLDTSIVNPKHLTHDLRMAICQQCHLQGEERITRRGQDIYAFRPGLPLELFRTVFVRHPDLIDYHKSVGQFEQMVASKCFTASGGKMDCTSCHDPHAAPSPSDAAAFYRARCLSCHDTHGCSLPPPQRQAKADNCVACHMPRASSTNIVHTAVTDHRVPRTPQPAKAVNPALDPRTPPLVPFTTSPHAPPADERERDLGIALAKLVRKVPASARALHQVVGPQAEQRLAAALVLWPGDYDAWMAQALLAVSRGDDRGVLSAATMAEALAPDSEEALAMIAEAALTSDIDLALTTADRLITANPSVTTYRTLRAQAHVKKQDWAAAAADCRAALAIFPHNPDARVILGVCLHKQGDAAAGQAELEAAMKLVSNPQAKDRFRRWYTNMTR